jgi:hypothetical protein
MESISSVMVVVGDVSWFVKYVAYLPWLFRPEYLRKIVAQMVKGHVMLSGSEVSPCTLRQALRGVYSEPIRFTQGNLRERAQGDMDCKCG